VGWFHDLTAAGLLIGTTVVLSCESSTALAGAEASTQPSPAAPDGPSLSAASEAPALPSLACLGAEAPLAISKGLPLVDVRVGDAAEHVARFLVDYATTRSTIDLSKFTRPGPTATHCDPTELGQLCTFTDFDFFGAWGEVSLRTSHYGSEQAGILGTDFTGGVALTLDYAARKVRRADKKTLCSAEAFAAAGFVPLSSTGFFTDDVDELRPLTDVIEEPLASLRREEPGEREGQSPSNVIADAHSDRTVANVPTVPLRLGDVTALAQLDTGFDDALVPFSVNVNEAFFAEVMSKSPTALVRAPEKDLSLSTCIGVAEAVEAYTLAAGASVELVGEKGRPAFGTPTATIFVKRTPPSARECGGIGTWTVPGAQVGATFFAAMGPIVFDPFGSRVWVRSRP
jgi:hypothetical protein